LIFVERTQFVAVECATAKGRMVWPKGRVKMEKVVAAFRKLSPESQRRLLAIIGGDGK
jgi:hypothetical protein